MLYVWVSSTIGFLLWVNKGGSMERGEGGVVWFLVLAVFAFGAWWVYKNLMDLIELTMEHGLNWGVVFLGAFIVFVVRAILSR
ncbi:hypothetical protein COY32_01725 [candidate division WWE3 bacterium CG_4_10_14_0_2_um_filter_41_14]|uniref:Uncharacterized protein n=1 Tax=candidate division WWE3 bacterium CG_4_10_14_0_2_um_filter_41_14 TaxID=1975072 RepID=A0A2M7TKQ4_UNCKA|nr:MAG: hypothetical protein COY32_01725 [candidate division WWE3 bacterium CG_4_10_14_0_2_um_filter_41_14]